MNYVKVMSIIMYCLRYCRHFQNIHRLHNYFQTILHQFLHGLNSCSPDTLLKVGSAYPEMAVQEKAVDMFVELLRKDQVLF
jgi:dynactin 1